MLPKTENIADIYELVTEFEETNREKNKTFDIDEVLAAHKAIDDATSSILGIGKLGVLRLNTYKIQTNITPINVISGTITGLESLQQSIYIMLNVECDQYIIYPYTYGLQTIDLFGKPSDYVMAVIPERITETLLSDDRITGVSDFEFTIQGNKLTVKFVVHSIYGDIDEETVVIY